MSIKLTNQTGIASPIVISKENISNPRELNRELWRPDRHEAAHALQRALRDLVEYLPRASRQTKLVEECGVTARSSTSGNQSYHAYARLAANAVDSQLEWFRLLQTTRQLGMATDYGQSTLDDVFDGPVAILDAADVATPTVSVDCNDFFDLKSNQRRALLEFLAGLSPGVDVRIIASHGTQRKLLARHRDDLPASVIDAAESGLQTPRGVATRTAKRRGRARELLADRGEDHPDWRRLQVVAQEPQERCSYDALEVHVLTAFDTRDALRQFVRRMSDDDLLEAYGPRDDRHVRLLPLGYVVLDEHPDLDAGDHSCAGGAGRTDESSQPSSTEADADPTTVSDPPNNRGSTVDSQSAPTGRSRPHDREGGQVTQGGAGGGSSNAPTGGFLEGWEHDVAATAADDGEIALIKRSADPPDDARTGDWSYLPQRDEVVVSVQPSGWVGLTLTRLCQTCLSKPAFQQVLTEDRLAGGPDRSGLDALSVDNPYVLRKGACFGYLKNADANAADFLRRLEQERNALGELADSVTPLQEASTDEQRELAQKAHGLLGVATRLYDMLGVDVSRVLQVPNWVIEDPDRRGHLVRMIAKQTAISARHGVYSAHRVLFEADDEKREDLLGAPSVDVADPVGDVCGSWVLVGDLVERLCDKLQDLGQNLVLQDDEENFAPFLLDVDVVDGIRRSVYAAALSRQARLRDLQTTRQTVSILRAFTSDPFAATRGLSRLQGDNNDRDLDHFEVRKALSFCKPGELVPDIGPRSVSKAVQTLFDAEEALSTSDLADAIDVDTQTLSNNEDAFEDLEALGLLEREDLGEGRATLWSITLPFRFERGEESAPTPTFSVGSHDHFGGEWAVEGVFAEILLRWRDVYHRDLPPIEPDLVERRHRVVWTGDLQDLIRQRPRYRPHVQLVIELLDRDPDEVVDELSTNADVAPGPLSLAAEYPSVRLGQDPSPDSIQVGLATAVD